MMGDNHLDTGYFGEKGVLLEHNLRVQCHICGKWFKQLGYHITRTEGLTTDEYKLRFGLRRGLGLISSDLKAKRSEAATTILIDHRHHGWNVLKQNPGGAKGKKHRLQTLNSTERQLHQKRIAQMAGDAMKQKFDHEHPFIKCMFCSKQFKRTTNQNVRKPSRTFCSFHCYQEYRQLHRKASDSLVNPATIPPLADSDNIKLLKRKG
jgi:hypothetical protein